MRGQKRTKEEVNELFQSLEYYLELGFSLRKACNYTGLPYSTMQDALSDYESLRAKTTALQNKVNVKARENLIESIKNGNIKDSKWWLEKKDTDFFRIDSDSEDKTIDKIEYVLVTPRD